MCLLAARSAQLSRMTGLAALHEFVCTYNMYVWSLLNLPTYLRTYKYRVFWTERDCKDKSMYGLVLDFGQDLNTFVARWQQWSKVAKLHRNSSLSTYKMVTLERECKQIQLKNNRWEVSILTSLYVLE